MAKVTNAELKTLITNNATTTNANFKKAKQAIDGKVDKVEGKGLSTNDYTTAEKNKLGGIAAGAQTNVVETVKVNGTALTPDANKAVNVEIPAATVYTISESASTTSGMLKTYVLKADGVEVSGSKIDIPKDYLLKSATIEACATAGNPIAGLAVGDPYLDFVFNTKDSSTSAGDTHQYVSLKGLVDIYTAGTGINVSNSNVISIDTSVVAQKSDLPTKVSDLTNDAGYLTAHQDISGKANSADLAAVATSGSYNDLSNKPSIPTNNNELTNGAGYQTAQDVTDTINEIFGAMSITAWDDITV